MLAHWLDGNGEGPLAAEFCACSSDEGAWGCVLAKGLRQGRARALSASAYVEGRTFPE